MAKAYVCERCGKTHQEEDFTKFSEVEAKVQELYDLCEKCLIEHIDFIKNKVKITYIDPKKVVCTDCSRRIREVNSTSTELTFCPISHGSVGKTSKPCYFFKPQI